MLWWIAPNTVVAAALAGLVVLIGRLQRVSPALRHALWLVVLVKLVMPPIVHWPWSPPDLRHLAHHQPASHPAPLPPAPDRPVVSPAHGIILLDELPRSPAPAAAKPAPAEAAAPGPAMDRPEPASTPEPPTAGGPDHDSRQRAQPQGARMIGPARIAWGPRLGSLAFDLWLAGTLGMAIVHGIRIGRFRRLLQQAAGAPQWLTGQVDELAARLGIPTPQTWVVPGIHTPLIWCLGTPRLVWPASLIGRLDAGRCRGVIVHELAHLRRRDHLVGWLELLAGCAWWWNPLFWYVRGQLDQCAELACDAWVVWALPNCRRAYAETLIDVSEQLIPATAPLPALGAASGGRRAFERRLTMIMSEHVPRKASIGGLMALAVLGLVLMPGWSQGQQAAKPVGPSTLPAAPSAPKAEAPAEGSLKLFNLFLESAPSAPKAEAPAAPSGPKAEAPAAPAALPAAANPMVGGPAPPGMMPAPPTPAAPSALGSPFPVSSPRTPANDRDRRLDALERNLQALLKEVQALRAAGGPAEHQRFRRVVVMPWDVSVGPVARVPAEHHLGTSMSNMAAAPLNPPAGPTVINLTRGVYKLPRAQAEALETFLREHVKAEVLDTKVSWDSLTITSTLRAQATIGQLISLMEERPVVAPPSLRFGADPTSTPR